MKKKYKIWLALDLLLFVAASVSFIFLSYKESHLQKGIVIKKVVTPAEQELAILKVAYPSVDFSMTYDKRMKDWLLAITSYGKTSFFYRCNGLYIPESELPNKSHYWRVLYHYEKEVRDPDFNRKQDGLGIPVIRDEEIRRIREMSSVNRRRTGPVSSKAIFDAIYDSSNRRSTELHLKEISLFGKPSTVHEKIVPSLMKVEEAVYEEARTNVEVQNFLHTLESTQAYNWREIRGSSSRSFHSYGIAIDILPKYWWNKIVYWGFEKQKGNRNWMVIPLKKRWMPPKVVVDIFEREGFIWGGSWVIWDNMHFEYHPELFLD